MFLPTGAGGGVLRCWFADKFMFCSTWLMDSICVCKFDRLRWTLLFMVVFDLGSCGIIDAFAANASPKDATVSSIELLSGGMTALAVYYWEPAAVSVSCQRLYGSCQKYWKLVHVWSALGSWRHSLYSDGKNDGSQNQNF